MAKQDLTKHQRGIVNRYYEHHETIQVTKLQELVSELYLADAKKAGTLWKRAEQAMTQMGIEPAKILRIVVNKDVKALAELVGKRA